MTVVQGVIVSELIPAAVLFRTDSFNETVLSSFKNTALLKKVIVRSFAESTKGSQSRSFKYVLRVRLKKHHFCPMDYQVHEFQHSVHEHFINFILDSGLLKIMSYPANHFVVYILHV